LNLYLQDKSIDTVLRINPHVIIETFDEGALLLQPTGQHVMAVDQTDQFILEKTGEGLSAEAIAGLISEAGFCDYDDAAGNIATLYNKLLFFGFVEKRSKYGEDDFVMAEEIALTSKFLRNPDVVLREEDDYGGLLYNPDTNQIKVINAVGVFIWNRCDGEMTIQDIVGAIQQEFEGFPVEEGIQDVRGFLTTMLETGFVGRPETID
jgi:hypothetical protein